MIFDIKPTKIWYSTKDARLSKRHLYIVKPCMPLEEVARLIQRGLQYRDVVSVHICYEVHRNGMLMGPVSCWFFCSDVSQNNVLDVLKRLNNEIMDEWAAWDYGLPIPRSRQHYLVYKKMFEMKN